MSRAGRLVVPLVAVVLVFALVTGAYAQGEGAKKARRGFGRGVGSGTLLGLLRLEQVQKELTLKEDQLAKVRKVTEELTAEMRKEFTALRDIQDREQRRAKMTELGEQFDQKAREQLRDVLEREQMMRLYQIRMQVRPVADSLASKYVADRLKLKDEQKTKLTEIAKDMQAKRSELFRGMRDATAEQRREASQKLRKLREEADEKALAVLTAEQRKAFDEMKGKKFELTMERGQR